MKKLCCALALLTGACATQNERERLILATSMGAAAGATGGAVLSPNAESRGLNAIVFGLTGALSGAIYAHLTGKPKAESQSAKTLREREAEVQKANRLFQLPSTSTGDIPPFLKDRISQIVIEEIPMQERIGEDGTLHEAHKAYRIKNPPELLPTPLTEKSEEQNP
jgi:hypothetical protein